MSSARAAAERRRELLARHASAYWQDAAAMSMMMIVQGINIIKRKVVNAVPAGDGDEQSDKCTFVFQGNAIFLHLIVPSLLMFMFVFGRERYILLRGQLAWIVKVFFGTGLGMQVAGRCCGWCPIIWQHRLLFINVANLVSPVPLRWHWYGSISAWIVAIVVDAAAPAAMCGLSLACLVNAVVNLMQAASKLGMRALLWQVLAGLISSNSLIHLTDCLVPGSVAIWQEVRFHRTRLQQQQQQRRRHQQAEPSVSTPGPSDAKQWASCKVQQTAAASQSVSSSKPLQGIEGHQQQRKQQSAVPSAALGTSTAFGSSSSLSRLPGSKSGPAAQGAASTTAAASKSEPAAQGAASTTAAAADGITRALTAVQATARATFGSSAASRLQQAGQHSTADRPIHYRSPVMTRTVTLKLQHPADAAPQDFAAIQHQMSVALQNHLNSGQASSSQHNSSRSNLRQWQITQCVSFKGCWQIVMHAIHPHWPLAAEAEVAAVADGWQQQQQQQQQQGGLQDIGSAAAEGDDHQLDQLDLQTVVQEVLQDWPGWSVIDARLLQPGTLSELLGAGQLQSPQRAGLADTAGEALSSYPQLPSSVSAAGSAAASAPAGVPSSRHALLQSGLSLCPAAVSISAGNRSFKVTLAVDSAAARQLQQVGVGDLRLVATQQPESKVLLDQVFELPHHADTAWDADLACDLHFDLTSCCVEASSWQQQQHMTGAVSRDCGVLFVTVLAGEPSSRQQALSAATGGSTAAAGPPQHQQAAGAVHCGSAAEVQFNADTAGTARPQTCHMAPSSPALGHHLILAHLPLLVLPGAVQLELEELLESAVSLGIARTSAYQQLLPLLQDWATLMWMTADGQPEYGGREKPSGSGTVENEQQYACKAIFNAIAAAFDDLDLTHCYKLLMRQQWQHSRQQLQPVALLREEVAVASGAADDGAVQVLAAATAGAGEQPRLRRHPTAAGIAAAGEGGSTAAADGGSKATTRHEQEVPSRPWLLSAAVRV